MDDEDVKPRPGTRDRIAAVATALFIERGFGAVTVAEVASAAGVSKVTVFNHFARKEDLLLDRQPEAIGMVVDAVRFRRSGSTAVEAIEHLAEDLAARRHPFSALRAGGLPLMRTVAAAPPLLARAREMVEEIEAALTALLVEDGMTEEAAGVLAATTVAAYRQVYVTTARRMLAGEDLEEVARGHAVLLRTAFGGALAAERAIRS